SPKTIDDARIDVGADHLEIVEAGQAQADERVDDRPRLIALRRPDLEHPGARGEIDAGSDDQHAADAARRVEPFQYAKARLHGIAGFDRGIGAQTARLVEALRRVRRWRRTLFLEDERHRAAARGLD